MAYSDRTIQDFADRARNCIAMLGYTPPRPTIWKALLATAVPVAFVTWSVRLFHVNIPFYVLVVLAIGAWLAISATVQSRMLDDWRSQYAMNLTTFEHETDVAPAVQIKDE